MQSSRSLDRLSATFDDDHAVANAGLLLSATLAQHLGLKDLFNEHVDLGSRPGRANPGDKAMTLIASLIAGGECIDDADALRRRDRSGARPLGGGAVHARDFPARLLLWPRPPAR
jgi:hypothetical protein